MLEAAKKYKSPVIIQASNGGGKFYAGKSVKDASAAVVGSVALAMHVRCVAKLYGVPVILHTDHCSKSVSDYKVDLMKLSIGVSHIYC